MRASSAPIECWANYQIPSLTTKNTKKDNNKTLNFFAMHRSSLRTPLGVLRKNLCGERFLLYEAYTVMSIKIALSKGRIFDETTPLLKAAGIIASADPDSSRKLIIGTNRPEISIIIVRASDVPTYVQYGAAELGIAGKDVLLEHGGTGLYQPLDLGIAKCKMMVAVQNGFDYEGAVRRGARLRVATKYLKTAREHFAAKGVHVDLIKLYGSMELAPLVGLADAIVDLVSSGNTLRANNLQAVEEIMPISARLIVNQAALKLKRQAIQPLLDAFAGAVAKNAK